MSIHSTLALRVVATTCAFGLVLASAGFGAIFAFKVGQEHSLALAVLSVVMAVTLEGVKPIAIAQSFNSFASLKIMRGLALALLGLVAVAYSLTSELSLVATSRVDLAAQREAHFRDAKTQEGKRNRIESELSTLGVIRPSQEIEAHLSSLLTDKRLNGCEGWLASVKLRETCIDTVGPLKAELAKAERRERLEAELRNLTTGEPGAVGSSDPGSTALATYLGSIGLVVQSEIISQWFILIPVLALELGSALALVLVQAVSSGAPPRFEPAKAPSAKRRRATARAIEPRDQVNWIRDRVSEAILRELEARGGTLVQSERALAKTIEADRNTVRRAIQDLSTSGLVSIETSRSVGTSIRLVR